MTNVEFPASCIKEVLHVEQTKSIKMRRKETKTLIYCNSLHEERIAKKTKKNKPQNTFIVEMAQETSICKIWPSFILGFMATELKSSHATVIYTIQTDIKVPDWGIQANIHTISEYQAEMFLLSGCHCS